MKFLWTFLYIRTLLGAPLFRLPGGTYIKRYSGPAEWSAPQPRFPPGELISQMQRRRKAGETKAGEKSLPSP